jgi:tetratricopeptide (TPR) repeat protein
VASYSDRTSNQKWQVNVQILNSRIHLKQTRIEEALALAEMAVDKAKSPESKAILPLVDAYITRGEAYLTLADSTKSEGYYSTARGNFEDALQCILQRNLTAVKPDYLANPKIAAVCCLRIAQCYARLGRQMNAKKHFAIWLRLEPHVEHEWVRELAEQVRTEIDILAMDFTISASDHHKWSYSDNVAKLRRWLLIQSLRQTNQNYSEAAKLIGVQRATLYQWQTQGAAGKRNRARTVED